MGKILLVHVPIKGVASKCNKREETRESELQYLQLWADGDCQEIMYYANCRKPSAEYRKFDCQSCHHLMISGRGRADEISQVLFHSRCQTLFSQTSAYQEAGK